MELKVILTTTWICGDCLSYNLKKEVICQKERDLGILSCDNKCGSMDMTKVDRTISVISGDETTE